jgi:hypothetical protein
LEELALIRADDANTIDLWNQEDGIVIGVSNVGAKRKRKILSGKCHARFHSR